MVIPVPVPVRNSVPVGSSLFIILHLKSCNDHQIHEFIDTNFLICINYLITIYNTFDLLRNLLFY